MNSIFLPWILFTPKKRYMGVHLFCTCECLKCLYSTLTLDHYWSRCWILCWKSFSDFEAMTLQSFNLHLCFEKSNAVLILYIWSSFSEKFISSFYHWCFWVFSIYCTRSSRALSVWNFICFNSGNFHLWLPWKKSFSPFFSVFAFSACIGQILDCVDDFLIFLLFYS